MKLGLVLITERGNATATDAIGVYYYREKVRQGRLCEALLGAFGVDSKNARPKPA
jgi:hypothetical protein